MSDVVFQLFLLLGLGIAVTQLLVGWQLVVIHQEFRRANEQRRTAIDQNVVIIRQNEDILKNQRQIIASLVEWKVKGEGSPR